MTNPDTTFQVLNDHYKDTFTHQREYLKLRDRLFVYVLLVFVGMFILMNGADSSYRALSDIAKEKLGTDIGINSHAVDTMLWFVLLSFVVRYYQTSIVVERQYVYLGIIETELNNIINKAVIFQREGKAYADYYKVFPTWVWIIYTYIFPTLLAIISGYKLWKELRTYTYFEITLMMDIIFYGMILTSTVTYIISYHLKK